jgi:hypothetical protein
MLAIAESICLSLNATRSDDIRMIRFPKLNRMRPEDNYEIETSGMHDFTLIFVAALNPGIGVVLLKLKPYWSSITKLAFAPKCAIFNRSILVAIYLFLLLSCSADNRLSLHKTSRLSMGTLVDVTIVAEKKRRKH